MNPVHIVKNEWKNMVRWSLQEFCVLLPKHRSLVFSIVIYGMNIQTLIFSTLASDIPCELGFKVCIYDMERNTSLDLQHLPSGGHIYTRYCVYGCGLYDVKRCCFQQSIEHDAPWASKYLAHWYPVETEKMIMMFTRKETSRVVAVHRQYRKKKSTKEMLS